ncbi:MAG: D-aminoacyl-tRNA deacylase [Nanoarchaeota archaeon]
MYQKFLIVACKKNLAAMNIISNLQQFRSNFIAAIGSTKPFFDIHLTEEEVLYNENLDMPKIEKYDFVIFPCTHRSESGEKTFSIHPPGNLGEAKMGGNPGKVSRVSALFQKQMFEKLYANVAQFDMKEFKVTMEVTHHGPTINKPCVFIEIGSEEEEWKNRRAGFIIAKTISDTINTFEENPYNEIAIGIGGPHYCPNFNKIQAKSNVAISHIIPSYVSPITEEMVMEAIKQTEEDVDFVVLDWKGFKSEQRQELIKILEKNYIQWKKTGDINKG